MLDFPAAPTVNQVFTSGALAWGWDGSKWKATSTAAPSGGGISAIDVTGSTNLPSGAEGVVNITNLAAAPITIGLPPAPFKPGQTLKFKDIVGNAGTYPIRLQPMPSGSVDGMNYYQLVSDYMSLELYWMGSQWGSR